MASSQDTSVSFEPSTAVPTIPGTGDQQFAEAQITRPPTVLFTLGLRCVCGVRLCGCEYWFFSDTLFVRGVCLRCGEQELIFAPPRVHTEDVEGCNVAAAVEDLCVSEATLREENERLRAELGTSLATDGAIQRTR